MSEKNSFVKDLNEEAIEISVMIIKRLYKTGNKTVFLMSDKTGYIKGKISESKSIFIGQVIAFNAKNENVVDIKEYTIVTDYKTSEYLITTKKSIESMMTEIEEISKEYIISPEANRLSDYFFKDEAFLDKFKRGIGGVSMHHAYIGGLVEHTLNVMKLTKTLCEMYDCRRKEIAVLGAKLHDIGKIYELDFDGPFKYTTRGQLEGHIVIGVQMIDEAIRNQENKYTEDFIRRIKGCIVQHHGKLEYGSPREANMEESIIINHADGIDAMMNKVERMKEHIGYDEWSEYDKKLEKKLYL